MATSALVPMFTKDGEFVRVLPGDVQAALGDSAQIAHPVTYKGQKLFVRTSDLGAALRDGAVPSQLLPDAQTVASLGDQAVTAQKRDRGTASQVAQQEDSAIGGLSRIPGNLYGGLKALVTSPFTDPVTGARTAPSAENVVGNIWIKPSVESAQHVGDVAAAHGQTGSTLEKAGEAISMIPGVGPWVMGTDQQKGLAERKSAAGILTEGLGTLVAGEGVNAAIGKGAAAIPKVDEVTTRAVRNTIPEAAQLPPKAISGAEDVFRAAAPVGSDPQFRANLYAATGDLAEIGRKLDLQQSRGGIIQPDLRPRATVDAINEHLSEMYQSERAPQIARNASAPVVPRFSADAAAGLDYLSRNAGTAAERALAERALSGESVPLNDVDALGRAVNRELSPLRGMTPQELAVSEGNSRRLASLQALDRELSQAIGNELSNRGEAGIGAYERRYAALSQVRDQLQARTNMAELQRHNPISDVVGFARKPSIAGASQAATANVNLGRMLENGFRKLADSGIVPNRPTGAGAPAVRGLLTPGAIRLPSNMEPIGGMSEGAKAFFDYLDKIKNEKR